MENVSRERCCAPVMRGGLNIVHIVTKCSVPSRYYRNCLNILSRLNSNFGFLPDDLSCKHLHGLLLPLPGVPPRCTGFFGGLLLVALSAGGSRYGVSLVLS